jgi:phosphoglycerate dehydrogenase-like enzyme
MSDPEKPKLLIYIDAYTRLRDQLDPYVTSLVVHPDASVHCDGKPLESDLVLPHIAWANRDMYALGPVREFMIMCLKSRCLNWLQSSAAGFEHPVFAKIANNGVRLTNSNASAVPIAEFVLAQVMSVFHPSTERLLAQQQHRWDMLEFRDLHASTWLVYGVGNIGVEVATRARAFGARVIGCRRTPRGDEPVDEMIASSALMEHVGRADVVVLTAALNADNRHVVNAELVAAMKAKSVLVNVGRGGLVDEQALLYGLERGTPDIAILDVFEQEPLPEDSPFWAHPRVRLTAHCAGASPGTGARGDAIFLANLRRYLSAEPLMMEVKQLETAS